MPDILAEYQSYVASLSAATKLELDTIIAADLAALKSGQWRPDPRNEPQCAAYYSQADLLLFGGAAGAGKTSLVVGLACTQQTRSVIFRAKAVDMRGVEEELFNVIGRDGWNGQDKLLRRGNKVIELGHLEKPGSEKGWQGRPHDYIGIDEGAQLARAKVHFVLGWLRSSDPHQRCRAVIASNPPTGGEGEWLMEWFAPWLDPKFANPAASGELRWAATAPDREGTTIWLPDSRPIVFIRGREYRYASEEEVAAEGKVARDVVTPKTRTFIPGHLDDNPYLRDTGYRAQLQALPEPLRSQLLHGDFLAGREDHEWQVIPTAWVKDAQARWEPYPPENAVMSAIGVDVAQGGGDQTVLAPRHGWWYAPLVVKSGTETPNPSDVVALVITTRRNKAAIVLDIGGGYGGGVKERLEENQIEVRPFLGGQSSGRRALGSDLPFKNKRAESYWRLREALDPDQLNGARIALPPDPLLLADLTSVRWDKRAAQRGEIQIDDKEQLKKPERLGRSPDRGDAVVMAWCEGEKAIISAMKKANKQPSSPRPHSFAEDLPNERGTGWMGQGR